MNVVLRVKINFFGLWITLSVPFHNVYFLSFGFQEVTQKGFAKQQSLKNGHKKSSTPYISIRYGALSPYSILNV